jgi:hypothetical protein
MLYDSFRGISSTCAAVIVSESAVITSTTQRWIRITERAMPCGRPRPRKNCITVTFCSFTGSQLRRRRGQDAVVIDVGQVHEADRLDAEHAVAPRVRRRVDRLDGDAAKIARSRSSWRSSGPPARTGAG